MCGESPELYQNTVCLPTQTCFYYFWICVFDMLVCIGLSVCVRFRLFRFSLYHVRGGCTDLRRTTATCLSSFRATFHGAVSGYYAGLQRVLKPRFGPGSRVEYPRDQTKSDSVRKEKRIVY